MNNSEYLIQLVKAQASKTWFGAACYWENSAIVWANDDLTKSKVFSQWLKELMNLSPGYKSYKIYDAQQKGILVGGRINHE